MRTSHLLAFVGFLFFFAVLTTSARGPQWTSFPEVAAHVTRINLVSSEINLPPTANADSYTLHGNGTIGPLLQNDSDPENNPMHVQIETFPTQGRLFGLDGNSFTYGRNSQSFFGTDTFTYKACDTSNACSGTVTVTVNIVNQAPVAIDDTYTVHGGTTIGPMMANDSDPDGDPITWNLVTAPAHGTLLGLANPAPGDLKSFAPESGYTGQDTFTYKVCDQFSVCSAPATVALNINNNPPVPGPDFYVVRGNTIIGPMYLNDYDPDGDDFISFGLGLAPGTPGAAHGTVFGLDTSQPGDLKLYRPNQGYVGLDSFQYQITDYLRASGTTTVTLYVLDDSDAENAGRCSPCQGNGGPMAVGGPVNVTNGNMYLQQTDYQLPGVGPALNITRTYNSKLKTEGLFGRGWSTIYDSSIQTFDPTFIRLNLPDGRAVYYKRPNSSSAFAAIEKDFHSDVTENSDGGFTLSFKDGGSQQFNAAGKLLALVDRHNNQTTLSYDGGGKLASARDPFGRVLSFNTNPNGQVVSISDSMGTIATYDYGSEKQLLSTTYADNSAYHFNYNGSVQLTSVIDALGNVLESHTYDSLGRALTSEKHGGVEHYTLNYVSDAQTDVTDALGHVTRYTVDKSKGRNVVTRVEGVCSCAGNSPVQTWTYDAQLNVIARTDALNHTTTFTYDAEGNRLTATDSTGTVTFTYNQLGEVLTRTDQMSGVTTNTYDSSGSLLVSHDALNNATTFTYDQRGELLTMTNALGKVTALAYDPSGNISQATDALGGVTSFVYDARGRLTSITNALNFVTSYAYDAAGRVQKLTRPDLSFITFTYDLGGRGIRVTDALNNNTNFAYDSAYRLTGVTDALGNSVNYSYDLMSNLTAATDQLGRTTNMEYDEFNRPIKTIFPPAVAGATRLQETIEYDAAGNVIRSTDQTGRISSFEYDAAHRLVQVKDPALQITRYEYNPRSNLIAVVDAINQRYTFNYDALSRVTTASRAGLQMSFVYDGAGNRTQRTDYNNMTTGFDYDALNRLIAINFPDSSSANYGYDKLSRLTSASNVNGTLSFTYDNLGRVAVTTDVWGEVLDYTYDANGRRTRLSLGATTKATYAYDSLNRLIKITDGSRDAVSYAYDVTGKLTSRSLPNNVDTFYSYDGLDRLTQLSDRKGNKVIADNQYSYNNAGNVTQNIDQSGIHGYGYDVLDRLISATYTGAPNEAYAYDGVGNRTSSHRSATYGYQPFNRLTNSSAASYLYDNNGNMISKSDATGTTQFGWDFEDRLTQTVMPTTGSVTYKYDALGRRIQRTPSNGVSTNFVYDGQEVVKDINSDGSSVNYLNGPGVDNKIRQQGSSRSNTYYFSQDRLGSTTALTGPNGRLIERSSYDAYGNSSGSTRTRYGFTGRERDPDTSLIYYRARWYDPQLGRFISEDPIGLAGGINQFAYVSNNPQNATDPSGLYEIDVHYYLTYFLAMRTGCFTAAEARLIADADQGTDENERTAPGPGWTERQQQQNRDYHDLQPGNHEGQGSPMLLQQAMSGRMNYVGFGQYLHHLQDSFSHAGYESDTYGHAAALHYYDKTASDVPKALRMAGATWKALNDYAEKKCGCRGTWDAGWWQQVVDFSKEHGANFDALETIDSNGEIDNFGMTNNPAYLLRKMAILGLTPR
jgi:RHS repeat-associated protein